MRHLHSGRKLGISAPHRKAMMRSLTLALIEREKIQTTPAKAKEVRRLAEKIITLGKKGDLSARRRAVRLLGSTRTKKTGENRVRGAIKRVFSDLAPRFKTRNGGYTRMIRLGRRVGDNAEICLMEFVSTPAKKKAASDKPAAKKSAKAAAKDKPATAKAKSPAKSKKQAAPAQDKPAKKAAPKKKEAPQDKPAKAKKG